MGVAVEYLADVLEANYETADIIANAVFMEHFVDVSDVRASSFGRVSDICTKHAGSTYSRNICNISSTTRCNNPEKKNRI
jgi:hypothetical protein